MKAPDMKARGIKATDMTATSMTAKAGIAGVLADLVRTQAGLDLPVRLRAWDGSEAGPAHTPVLIARTPRALSRILWRPGELGLARAYVSGDLEVDGDLTQALRLVRQKTARQSTARQSTARQSAGRQNTARRITTAATAAIRLKIPLWPRPAPPDASSGSAAACTAGPATGR